MLDYYSKIEKIVNIAGSSSNMTCTNSGWIKSSSEYEDKKFKLYAEIYPDPITTVKKIITITYKGKEVYKRNHTHVNIKPGLWQKEFENLENKLGTKSRG